MLDDLVMLIDFLNGIMNYQICSFSYCYFVFSFSFTFLPSFASKASLTIFIFASMLILFIINRLSIVTNRSKSDDTKILPASINSRATVFPEQLHFHSSLPQNLIFFCAPEKLAVLGLNKVIELGEITGDLIESLKEGSDGDVHHLGVKLEDFIEFFAIGRQWLLRCLLALLFVLFLTGFQRYSSAAFLAVFLLLLLIIPRVSDGQFQLLIFEGQVAFHALSLHPCNNLLHLCLSHLRQVLIVT